MRIAEAAPRGLASLVLLGAASTASYALVAWRLPLSNTVQDVVGFLVVFGGLFALYAAAGVLVRRSARPGRDRSLLLVVLGFALVFRAVFLFAGLPHERPFKALARDLAGLETGYSPFLIYDNDVWRYLWDGHLVAHGLSPYALTPRAVAQLADAGEPPYAALLTEERWWDVLDNVSFQGYTTVYPPLAQGLFALCHRLAPGSVFVLKLMLMLVDLGSCAVLAALLAAVGRSRTDAILYAWNPLVVKELVGSAHVDALMVMWLTLSLLLLVRGRPLLALVAYGASVLSKLGSLALLVLFLRRTRPRYWAGLAAVLAAGSLPFARDLPSIGLGLMTYGREWVFNSGPWAAIEALATGLGLERPAAWAHGVTKSLALFAVVVGPWTASREPTALLRVAFGILAVVVLLNPAVMPWYLLWALPLAVAVGSRAWLVLTAVSLLSYLFFVDGVEHSWWLWVEYGVFGAVLAAEWIVCEIGSPGRRPPADAAIEL